MKTVKGGALYDTAMIINRGGGERSGGAFYDTAMICKGV